MLNLFINNQNIMKTNQLILAAAIIAIAGCTKSNVETNVNAESNEIGFNAVTRVATKANNAIVTGTTYGTDNTFQVWGWQSENGLFTDAALTEDAESNFMKNLTISYCGGPSSRTDAWRNADHYYYWPFTGAISFMAIHPSTVVPTSTGWDATNKKGKATIEGYTIATGNKTTDLMFADASGSRRADALPLVFKHALSQIEVQVKTNDNYSSDVQFDVKSVTFNNIDLSGNVTYANSACSWSANTAQTEDWLYYDTVKENISNTAAVYGAANVMIPQAAHNAAAAVGEPGDPEYVAADPGTTLTIEYAMQQLPKANNAKINGTVTVAAPQEWAAGSKYVYTLNFNLYEILFNPSVEADWVTVNVATINIP